MGLERKIEFISGHVGFEGSIVYYGFKHQRRDLEIQFRFGSQQQHIPNIHADKWDPLYRLYNENGGLRGKLLRLPPFQGNAKKRYWETKKN